MYYAEIDEDNSVLRVIVADAAFIASQPGRWVRTCMSGIYSKNYAGIGQVYNEAANCFDENPYELIEKVEPAKDENGKQLYYKSAYTASKSSIVKRPILKTVFYLRNKKTGKITKSKRSSTVIYPE